MSEEEQPIMRIPAGMEVGFTPPFRSSFTWSEAKDGKTYYTAVYTISTPLPAPSSKL